MTSLNCIFACVYVDQYCMNCMSYLSYMYTCAIYLYMYSVHVIQNNRCMCTCMFLIHMQAYQHACIVDQTLFEEYGHQLGTQMR